MSSQLKTEACGGEQQRGLEHELEEKLLLHDDDAGGSAPPPEKKHYGGWRRRRHDDGHEGVGGDDDYRERFVRAYDRLRDELLADDSCELTDEARRWLAQMTCCATVPAILNNCLLSFLQMIDYNVPGGKLNRGLSVIDSYLLLRQGSEVTEDEFFLACVIGWCVEWFQACALLLDDIMDDSHTRRDHICWYRRPEVGLRGINDGILLKCHIARLIKKYFREKSYYIDISELWNEVRLTFKTPQNNLTNSIYDIFGDILLSECLVQVALQTSLGQMLDLISTHNGADELAKYNIEGYRRIVKYKTSYYSFYLPVACALLLSGAKLENFSELRDILIEMGIYFQAQKNYGKKDSTSVSKVKSTYSTLDLKVGS
nr:unnamed protein product [Digitaria exilis]